MRRHLIQCFVVLVSVSVFFLSCGREEAVQRGLEPVRGFLAQYYTIHYPECVAGLVLMGASTGMWVEMERSRQGEFITDEERNRMREIRKELRKMAQENGWPPEKALALIWQGHMLDLLGKRKEAIACYKQVADMNIDESWQHSQYRLTYRVSPYARERMTTPFQRIENKDKD